MKAFYDSIGRRLVRRRSEFINLHPLHKLQKQFTIELTSSVRQQLDWRTKMGENLRDQHSGYRSCGVIWDGDHFSPFGEMIDYCQYIAVVPSGLRVWSGDINGDSFPWLAGSRRLHLRSLW